MLLIAEDIKKLPAAQKAELYYLLQEDKELQEYLNSNSRMFDELRKRDKDFSEGKIRLTTRKELSLRLKNRRDAL